MSPISFRARARKQPPEPVPLQPLGIFASFVLLQVPLHPSDAVRLALQQNPKLRAARAEREASLAQNDREKPVARPSVSVEALGQLQGPRVSIPRSDRGDETVIPERYGRLEVMVEQLLYRAGAGAARTRYAAQNRSADWELRKAEQEVSIEAVRAYYALEGAEAQVKVADEGVAMARRQLSLTRDMLSAGTASERDMKASDADLAEAELGRSRAAGGVALARANLNRLLGRDPASRLELGAAGPLPAVPALPDEAQKSALAQRPELHLLEESLSAARAGVSLAATQNQPTLSARAIGAAQTPTALTDSHYLAAGLVLRWNPFDQGKTRADVREARARVSQLEALMEDARLGIRLEVEKAWLDMRTAQERIEVSNRQIASAESALEISRLRYEVGSATQLEVSGSLFGVVKARANRAQAETDLRSAHAELQFASGQTIPAEVLPGAGRP